MVDSCSCLPYVLQPSCHAERCKLKDAGRECCTETLYPLPQMLSASALCDPHLTTTWLPVSLKATFTTRCWLCELAGTTSRCRSLVTSRSMASPTSSGTTLPRYRTIHEPKYTIRCVAPAACTVGPSISCQSSVQQSLAPAPADMSWCISPGVPARSAADEPRPLPGVLPV